MKKPELFPPNQSDSLYILAQARFTGLDPAGGGIMPPFCNGFNTVHKLCTQNLTLPLFLI